MSDRYGEGIRRGAEYHDKNRLTLSRTFGPGPRALVIGCNPSDADALKDDPTSLWWNRWFEDDGFGGYDAVNLYPFCTSSPAECRRIVAATDHGAWGVRDDMHFVNLAHVVAKAKAASKVFICWGAIAWDIDWVDHVVGKSSQVKHRIPTSGAGGRHSQVLPSIPWRGAHTASRPINRLSFGGRHHALW